MEIHINPRAPGPPPEVRWLGWVFGVQPPSEDMVWGPRATTQLEHLCPIGIRFRSEPQVMCSTLETVVAQSRRVVRRTEPEVR